MNIFFLREKIPKQGVPDTMINQKDCFILFAFQDIRFGINESESK